METEKVEQTTVNEGRTSDRIDTRLTQRPVRGPAEQFIVFRKISYGPFNGAGAAWDWATKQWPDGDFHVYALHDPAKVAPPLGNVQVVGS